MWDFQHYFIIIHDYFLKYFITILSKITIINIIIIIIIIETNNKYIKNKRRKNN